MRLVQLTFFCLLPALAGAPVPGARVPKNRLLALRSPVLFRGDARTAYRDPAALFANDSLYLFFTLVRTEADNKVYSYVAMSQTQDLRHWSRVRLLTPRNQRLDYSSPGNIVRFQREWVLCLQTYPRPDYTADQMPRFGTADARLFTMRSPDLHHWAAPELLRVKGPDVDEKSLGRMIDPYLLEDQNEPGRWWCFYKQNGVSRSYSPDLRHWTYAGHTEAGENACVLVENHEYVLLHSPKNGLAFKRSADLQTWRDWGGVFTLGQAGWPWARGRLTAGTVLDLRQKPGFGQYVLLFHGSGPRTEEAGDFDKNASIGLAWSDDLQHWRWPGQRPAPP